MNCPHCGVKYPAVEQFVLFTYWDREKKETGWSEICWRCDRKISNAVLAHIIEGKTVVLRGREDKE